MSLSGPEQPRPLGGDDGPMERLEPGKQEDDPTIFLFNEANILNREAEELEKMARESIVFGIDEDIRKELQAQKVARRAEAAALRERAQFVMDLSLALAEGNRVDEAREYLARREEEAAAVLREKTGAVNDAKNSPEAKTYLSWRKLYEEAEALAGGEIVFAEQEKAVRALREAMSKTDYGRIIGEREEAQGELQYVQRVKLRLVGG